ncbi:DUF302 domain-containing protein [Streptomyces sp. NPDC020096]
MNSSAVDHRDTVARLITAVERRDLTVFARFDHAELARGAHLDLAPLEVVVFGNPAAGTPLMRSDPRVGIELPLRMLVWVDDAGEVLVGYDDPRELADRYDLDGRRAVLDRMAALLAEVAAEAAAEVPK